MSWPPDLNLENIVMAVGQFGGPIAMARDNKKFIQKTGVNKPVIGIYSGSGVQISSVVVSIQITPRHPNLIISIFSGLVV